MSESALVALIDDPAALRRRQLDVDRALTASGAGHLVHDMHLDSEARGAWAWRLDPIPYLLDGATFDSLATAVTRRMQALEAILADLYGARQLIRDGVIAGEALSASARYRLGTVGAAAPQRWLTTYACDVVQLADGTWRVVGDLTDTPTGVGFALLDRAAMLTTADELLGGDGAADLASLDTFGIELRRALLATSTAENPRVVLYSPGVEHPAYVDHSALARTLGFTLVERPDLVVRERRLWMRALAIGSDDAQRRLDRIDVVYRRVGDAGVDPIELGDPSPAGVPGLLGAVDGGGVALANAHGTGLLEDISLRDGWAAAAEALDESLDIAYLGADDPPMATVAAYDGREAADTSVVVRLFAVAGPRGVVVMPGGNGRVLAVDDDPRRPTARRAKDVWVIGGRRSTPPAIVAALPQVDFADSVPTRAADALYWGLRAAERAGAIARTVRSVAVRRRQDPALVLTDDGRWARLMVDVLGAVRARPDDDVDEQPTWRGPFTELAAALDRSMEALGATLRDFVVAAGSVGEFLSTATARSLRTIVDVVDSLGDVTRIDEIDDVLTALDSFMGLWNESTVRGPVWRFGDIGVRLERALVVTDLAGACLEPVTGPELDAVASSAIEVLLVANESLVAYRRQFRSDVELTSTLDLLLHDGDNPRGYAAACTRLAEHVDDVGWRRGAAQVATLATTVTSLTVADLAARPVVLERMADAGELLRDLADDVVATWFATPVRPTLVRAR